MLEVVVDWYEANRNGLAQKFDVELTHSPPDWVPQSVWVDITTPKYLAQFTVWATGMAQLLIVDVDTGDEIRNEHLLLDTAQSVQEVINSILETVRMQ